MSCAAMISFAPGLFSTITCCPQASVSFCPSERASRSAGPPAVYGTTTRIGFVGKLCACASAANSHPKMVTVTIFMLISPPLICFRIVEQLHLVIRARQGLRRHHAYLRREEQRGTDFLRDRLADGTVALDQHGQRRLLLHAFALRPDEDSAGHLRLEARHDLAHRRRKDIDAAHDQHVVGAADAAHPQRAATT